MLQSLRKPEIRVPAALLAALALGAAFAAVDARGAFWVEWLASALILWLGLLLAYATLGWSGAGRGVAWMMALAFLLRLGCGIALDKLLPVAGYADNPVHQAGYVFFDAYHRDAQAWDLARSNASLLTAFTSDFANDQYGGLLSVSAFVYRYLSPDTQRPLLIVLLGAIAAALGVPFLWGALRQRWGGPTAATAGWILALYPEAILLGSSQMREPFLITFIALLFWAAVVWGARRRAALGALAAGLIGLLLFSWRVALPALGLALVWAWLEYTGARETRFWRVAGWAGLALAGLAFLGASWSWLQSSMRWDVYLSLSGSGWVKKLTDELGGGWAVVPFVTLYGLAQPVLPAAVAAPAPALLRVLGSLRAAGWYALAPFIVYSTFTIWKEREGSARRLLVWAAAAAWVWILVASARAGGDQWDNPRYRTIFLPWLAFLAAWGLQWARAHRDAWLWRWLAVEGIFLLFFTNWYASRYYRIMGRLQFWTMVVLILVFSAAVLVGGWIWDRRKRAAIRPPS